MSLKMQNQKMKTSTITKQIDISENNLFGKNIISNSKKYLYTLQFPDSIIHGEVISLQLFSPFRILP